MNPGLFVISLDFELHWGVRDHTPVAGYRDNLLGVRDAVPELLRSFGRRGIHATWATVGMLFCATKAQLVREMPERLPRYADPALSPYDALDEVGEDEKSDPFHFASSLVDAIVATPHQELATHTFSHYYCLEAGQTADDFDADLTVARRLAAARGVAVQSIVFPRNQHNPAYDAILAKNGIRAIRTSGPYWAYRPRPGPGPRLARAARLLDAYVPLMGRGGSPVRSRNDRVVDVPATRFLRPFSHKLRHLDVVRIRRITQAIRRAAARGEAFHLWWHPHNFGVNLRENMAVLNAILDTFEALRRDGKMESVTMLEASRIVGH